MKTTTKRRWAMLLLSVFLAAVVAATGPLASASALAQTTSIDQFYPPYPDAGEGSWPVIRHDPYNSDFSQNAIDPELNYAASMDPAWEKICKRSYPPVKGETPQKDTGGLNDVSHFAGSVFDQAGEWRRLDSLGEVVASGTGILVTTVSKGYANGVPEGSIGCPHVLAYGADGTLLWTSDEWLKDSDNWIDRTRDEYDDFNRDPESPGYVSRRSQRLPSARVISSSVVLDDRHRVYVADEKYLWAADAATGDLVWKWRMPSDDPYDPSADRYGSGASGPFVTAFFTRNGEVGGIHISGRVTVFPKMETGRHGVVEGVAGATYLPGAYKTLPEISEESGGMPLVDLTEILWYPGKVNGKKVDNDSNPELWMIDPELVDKALAGFAGTGTPAANTPATCPDPVDAEVTRIFAPVLLDSSTGENRDAKLMRVDYRPGPEPSLVEPWGSSDVNPKGFIPGGNGSATSPDVSESGHGVFIVDQNGSKSHLYGFSTETGELLWKPVLAGTMYGSTLTTWDGDNTPADPANGIDEDDLVFVEAEGKLIEVEQHSGRGGDLNNPAVDFNMPENNSDPRIDDLYMVDSDGDRLEDTVMPEVNHRLPRAMISSVPVGSIPAEGEPGRTELDLTFPLAVGYQIMDSSLTGHKPESLWPVKVMLITARRSESPDGAVSWSWVRVSDLKDTCETSSFPDASGSIWVSHIGTQSSFANGLKDKYWWLLVLLGWGDLLKPRNKYLSPVEPSGGITRLDVISGTPSVKKVSPSSGNWGYPAVVTVSGADFAANARVRLVNPASGRVINPVNTKVVSRSKAVCGFCLLGAPFGKYNVEVTNPDGQVATFAGGFTVRL